MKNYYFILDLVLKKLKDADNNSMLLGDYVGIHLTAENFGVTQNEIFEIYAHLIRDGYIYINTDGSHRINLTGIIFIENGGYTQKEINDDSEKNRILSLELNQKEIGTKMYYATVILTIGTSIAALYYLHELLKNFSCH